MCTDWKPLDLAISPGKYPAFLSLARFEREEKRAAFAWVRIADGKPVKWKLARTSGDRGDPAEGTFNLSGDMPDYGVDSGIAGFLDESVYRQLSKTGLVGRLMPSRPPKWVARMMKELETTSNCEPFWRWIDLAIDGTANVLAFSTGWGDGLYRTYAGYDKKRNLVAVVTDFNLAMETLEPDDET
jgi:hypothetical protein